MKRYSIYQLIDEPEKIVKKTFLVNQFVTKMTMLNRKSNSENVRDFLFFLIFNLSLGTLYFAICSFLFADMWYQKLIVGLSSVLFIYLNFERKLEKISDALHDDLIDAIEKFLHHYHISKGAVVYALEKTIERSRKNIRPFLNAFYDAFQDADQENKIIILKSEMPNNWLSTFLEIITKGKVEGYNSASGIDPIAGELQAHLGTLTQYMNNKLRQDAKLMNNQTFCIVAPLVVIPLALLINRNMVTYLEMANPYDTVTAKNISSLLLLFGNAGGLLIHWVRKFSV